MKLVNHIYREGERTPLVLIHAFPVDHRMWEACIDEMTAAEGDAAFPIWAPDMAGSGESPVPTAEESGPQLENGAYPDALNRLSEAYVDLVKEAGFDKAVFAGLSMGGYVTMNIQRTHPEMVAGLALCDTMAASDGVGGEGRLKTADAVEAANSVDPVMHFAEASESDSTVKQSPEFCKRMSFWIREQNPAGVAWRQRMTYGRENLDDVPATITAPTVVISGDLDPSSNPAVMEPLSKKIHGAEFVEVENCGHFSAVEHPDVVAGALLRLMERVQEA